MNQALQNMREVKAALLLRGWPSVAAWAAAHGFLPVTVRSAIYHWWHRTDREPLGGIGRQVMAALRKEMARPEQRRAA
ncbi:MAG: hypothetical protein N3C59_02190 [Azovibrio sp.]|nr:hypothetical protein [Azovibrio sp.]